MHGSQLDPAQQITLADQAAKLPRFVEDGKTAEPVRDQEIHRFE
jgi:hypothetical protein